MDPYAAPDPNSDRPRDRVATGTVPARSISFEAMPSGPGRFVREDERPRTESYGELYQRASVFMRRR